MVRPIVPLTASLSETQKKRLTLHRIEVVCGILLIFLLIIVARLMELQILRGAEYEESARSQHYGGIALPAKRGEIFSLNSKTDELNILATNTTLDLLYVDPFVTPNKKFIAEFLAETLLTQNFDTRCREGSDECPREFRKYYEIAFNPLHTERQETAVTTDATKVNTNGETSLPTNTSESIPPLEDLRRAFAHDTEQRISEEFVSFVPLLYGATKVQMLTIQRFGIPGIFVSDSQKLIYANPMQVSPVERRRIAKVLEPVISLDQDLIAEKLRRRRLRYVPIFRRLPSQLSKVVKERKVASFLKAVEERQSYLAVNDKTSADAISDPLRGIALIPEHWRFYPDLQVASQTVGFLNINQKAQNGIERTFDHELRGQEGHISALTDPFGGQIVSEEQTVIQAHDGKSVVLTIDRFLQKQVEDMLQEAVDRFEADSGQVLVMDPTTGGVIVMANAPIFDANDYSMVYEKVPLDIPEDVESSIVVEIYHPESNDLVARAFVNDLSPEGRTQLSNELQETLSKLETFYDLDDLKHYFLYRGENNRYEIFPIVDSKNGESRWLRYRNRIGVGAYLNRTVQTIYEPGSVFKPLTMAIAIDQGEVTPDDTYLDEEPVKIDEYTIKNALNRHFGKVTMTDCLTFSVNTCLTSVSKKLGKKLFATYIDRFGFGKITNIQIEDEQAGQVLDWRRWSDALLATASYGQGISVTPLQIVTAYSALANGGKLVKPTIIDRWIYPDGTEDVVHPQVLDQVITPEAAATVTAMLVNGVNEGFARTAKIPGYRMAGKTGTSQIAGPGGKYEETGTGSFITSFAGYAPIDSPKFVMLVKFDRPRAKEYGSQSAAPLFKKVAALLFDYYGIPPDET